MRTPSPRKCRLDLAPPLADRFIVEVAPIDYGPILLLMPFGSHLAMDTLPSGVLQVVASGPPWPVSGFRFRARLGFVIPSTFPAREALPPRFILRNPAYGGVACFGKTRLSARAQMRPQRRRGVTTPSNTGGHQRPREEWIEIPVPALVTEETFARAQELLYQNKIRSRRRTIAPSIVQGLVGCAKCGYAFSRTSTQTSARK